MAKPLPWERALEANSALSNCIGACGRRLETPSGNGAVRVGGRRAESVS